MDKKILIPIDNSEASLNALRVAIHIATAINANLHVIYISDITGGKEMSDAQEDSEVFYFAFVKKMLGETSIRSSFSILEGIVGHVIVQYVSEKNIDTVIMSAHGKSRRAEYIIDPNSYYVIKRVTCPVLLIPELFKRIEFKKILFPVRSKIFSRKLCQIIEAAIGNDLTQREMMVLGIFTDRYDQDVIQLSSKVFEVRKKRPNSRSTLVLSFCRNPDVAEEVLTISSEIKADLVVISPGIDALSRPSFIGPFSQKIINHTQTPILSLAGCVF